MRTLIAVLLLAVVAHADVWSENTDSGVSDAVERTLRDDRFEWMPATRQSPISAAAAGGVMGWLDVRVSAWLASIDGEMSDNGNETLDFQSDLGLDDEEVSVVPQIHLSFGGLAIRFDAFFLEFSGENLLSRDFTFGGFTFTLNENITSRVEINNYRLFSLLRIVNSSSVAISLQGGISYFQLSGEVTGETTGTGSESIDVPIPIGGLLAQIKIGQILFELDVVGLTLSFDDFEATVIDFQASVGVTLFKVLAIRGGYRYISVDADVDDFQIDATLDGFFVGLSGTF